MKKKGFTLIELLAVLVILAIIALITIPIVIRTINNSEENAEKQSIIGYARAIEDDIANYMMINAGKKYTDYVLPNNLDYKGNEVKCSTHNVSSDGKLTLTCCKVVGGTGTGYNYENGKVEKSNDTSCNTKEDSDDNQPSSKTAVETLLKKTNDVNATYTSGSDASHQMYTFEHPATEQTDALTDYRYIGSDPYNYVEFNDEVWRIIGIFTVEDENGNKEQRIKIIKDEELTGTMAWDSTMVYESDWPTSIINNYLNGEYYTSLSNSTKEMIKPAKIYLGGGIYNNTTHYGTGADMYVWERGTARYYDSINVNDINNISLIYPSDYMYSYAKGVDNTCYNDGYNCSINGGGNPSLSWLYASCYLWTVSPKGDSSNDVFVIYGSGIVYIRSVYESYLLRPVTYLKSSVKIVSGTGTSSDPYKLKI